MMEGSYNQVNWNDGEMDTSDPLLIDDPLALPSVNCNYVPANNAAFMKPVNFIKVEPKEVEEQPQVQENYGNSQMRNTYNQTSFQEADDKPKPLQKEVNCKKCNEPCGLVRQGNLFIKGFCKQCLFNDAGDEQNAPMDSTCQIAITEVKSLVCSYCTKVFNSVEQFDEHCEVRHSLKYVCKQCKSVFCSEGELKKHGAVHATKSVKSDKPVVRKASATTTQNRAKRGVTQNKKLVTRSAPKRVSLTSCFLCFKRFPCNEISEHMLTHKTENELMSKRSNKKSVDKDEDKVSKEEKVKVPLQKEKETRPSKEPISLVEFGYSCNVCQGKYENLDSLLEHLNGDSHVNNIVKITGGNLACKLCDNVYSNISELRAHVINKDHLLSYNLEIRNTSISSCLHCNVCFVDDSHLKTHVRIYHDDDDVSNKIKEEKEVPSGLDVNSDKKNDSNTVPESSRSSQKFPCKLCKQVFTYRTSFVSHMKNFHRQNVLIGNSVIKAKVDDDRANKYKCMTCGVWCRSLASIKNHIRRYRHKMEMINSSNNADSVKESPKGSAIARKFKCATCGLTCQTYAGIKKHAMKFRHKMEIINSSNNTASVKDSPKGGNIASKFKCATCGLTCQTFLGIKRHAMNYSHTLEVTNSSNNTDSVNSKNVPVSKEFVCSKCEKVFETDDLLKSHAVVCGNTKTKDGKKVCKRCRKSFDSEAERIMHCITERHFSRTLIVSLTCSCCKNVFMSGIYSLARHLRSKLHKRNDIKKVITDSFCKLCNSSFTETAEAHVECSSHINAFIESLLVDKSKLARKKRSGNFKCDLCNFKFVSMLKLKIHVSAYHNSRTDIINAYQCTICLTKFNTKDKLSRHIHSHVKMFECTYCNKKFSFNYLLERHLQSCAFNI